MADVQAAETAAQRYDRDFLHMVGNRKSRMLDQQTAERKARRYVNRTNGVSATGASDAQATALWQKAFG